MPPGILRAFIPVIYAQPNILTSRVTGSFVYDTRDASIDPTKGRSLSVSVGLAGLGGDVRTYQPTLEFTQFFRVRNKKIGTPACIWLPHPRRYGRQLCHY